MYIVRITGFPLVYRDSRFARVRSTIIADLVHAVYSVPELHDLNQVRDPNDVHIHLVPELPTDQSNAVFVVEVFCIQEYNNASRHFLGDVKDNLVAALKRHFPGMPVEYVHFRRTHA